MKIGRSSKKYKNWRNQVYDRDNGICVKCGDKHERMHCDHIIPWKESEELRFDIQNGQTLCARCHLKKGRENKEIVNDIKTRFEKGKISKRKGIKTGKPAWNSGTKGICKAWNKGKKCSEETKNKISESRKGKCLNNTFGFKKNQTSWNKGISATEEQRNKCRLANLGKRLSPRTEFKKGMIPWNKGIKKCRLHML